ncbi:uncharacterized protein LOC119114847 [Pollicipes pollicipes]|uniref:uncharacterized protein LOC119114847 n=1 Tax=Pollicipes pollicipes TaxID=41117 RepID=UPI0018858C49|nr:uncharacterized protein LOC119114847 [Pollicipes pollicipes]
MDWTENYQFLDSAYTMPTIAGFPFVLKAVGTATVSLKTGGSFNIESWDKMNINGHVKPSAAVEIMSEMVVDAHVAHTGLKMNTNLHTSTVFDGHAIVDSGKMVSVRINMPREKVEILDINTRFHSVFRNKARKLEMHTDNRYELVACSDRYVSPQLLGVNFCTDIRYSQGSEGLPSVLLSGPLTARFTIEKTDTIKGFEFEYRHSNEASVRKSSLVIDTPGSATDRRINVDYMINFEQKAFKAGFRTPIKSMDVSGSLDLAGQTKQFDASLKMDDRELAGVAGRLEVDETPVMVRYSPSFSVRGPAGELVAFDGGLIVSKNKHKYNVDITISKLYQTPIVLKGAFSEDDGTYNVLTSVESYVLDSNMKGSFRFAGDNLIIHANTDYSFMNGERQTIIVSSKMSKDERDDLTAYKLFLDTKFSALPILDTQLTAERQVTSEGCESRLVLTRGERHYELNTMLSHGDKMAASLGVVVAHWDVDFKLGGEMDFSQDHKVVVGIEGRLNKEKFARGKLGLDFKSEQHGFNYGVSADLDLPFAKYSMQTGVRREEEAAHLKMVVVRQTSAARDEVALVALLAREHGQFEVDLTLSVPHYPRWQAAGRLVPGTGGLYLARATLQGGERRYTLGAEYKLQEEHVLELLLEAPGRRFSGLVSALVTGDSPRVKVDLRCDRRVMAVFTALPYGWEKTANFEIFWNKDVDDTQKASFDVLLRGNIMAASLKYPGRLIKLDATLTATELTADLQYAPGKTIHIVRKDQRVGRNGFTTTVNVDTPIEGFTTMSLTLFKKPDVEQDDLLSSDLLVNFEVSGNVEGSEARMTGLVLVDMRRLTTIKTEVDLVTPFRGWEHNQLNFNYHMDRTTFTALASATKNEDQIALGGTFELSHNSDAFKINAGLEVALPTDALRKAKIGFHFKMGDRHLDTGILARWMTTKDMEVSLNFNSKHVLERQTDIDSTLTLKTPFKNAEKFVTNFKFFLDHHRLHTSFSLKDNVREIFLALLEGGSEAAQAYSGKLVINCAVCPGFDVSYDLTPTGEGAKWRIAAHWNAHETSLSGLFAQERQPHGVVGTKTVLTLVLPNPPTTYELRQRHEINVDKTTLKEHLELRRDNEKIIMDMNSKWTQVSSYGKMTSVTIAGHGTLTSPFKGWEYSQISQTVEVNVQNDERVSYVGQTKILKGDKTIEMTDTAKFENALNWQYRREVISNTRWFERLAGSLQLACRSASDATLTGSAEWDGETAELLYSHNIPAIHAMSGLQGHSSDVAISITATWFGGVSKTLKLANRESSETYHPSLTVNYNVGKTVKLYGALSKAVVSGESHIAFEAPFTEKVTLSVNPTWQTDSIQVVVRYMHGSKSYSADATMTHDFPSAAQFDVKFASPDSCLGKGAVSFEFEMDDKLELKGKLSHNDWGMSVNGELERSKGSIEIGTPYEGFTSLSLAYVWDGMDAELRLKRESNQILIVADGESNYEMLTYNVRVNTPYYGYETMVLTFNKPSRENKFTLEYVRGRETSISVVAEYALSGPGSSIAIETQTSFKGFSSAAMHLSYNLIEQTARIAFIKEDDSIEANLIAALSMLHSKMSLEYQNSLIPGPKKLTVTGEYSVENPKKSFSVVVLKATDKFAFSGNAQLMMESSFLTLEMESPIQGYENAKLAARFDSSREACTAKLEASKNDQVLGTTLHKEYMDGAGKLMFAVETPFENSRHIQLAAECDISSFPLRAKLSVEKNTIRHEITALMESTDDSVLISITTPVSGFEQLSIEGGLVEQGFSRSAHLVLTRNQDQIRAVIDGEFSWTKSAVALEITSPFSVAKSLNFIARYDLRDEQKTFSILLARNGAQIQMNGYGIMKVGAAKGLLQLETPYPEWESVKYAGVYDVNHEEKIMEISYEKNGIKKVIASRGSYNGETAYLDVITPVEGYERMGINGQYISRRGKREAGYDAHVNDHRHRLYVLYERVGKESAKLRIESPIEGMRLVEADIRSQTFPDGVGYYINTNRDGKRNSAEIRAVFGENDVGVDISIKSYVEGLESLQMSGNVVYRGRKRSFSFKSNRGGSEAEVSGEAVIKRRAGNGSIKAKLPIEGMEDVDVSFDYKLGKKKSFRLTSIRGGETREFSGDLQYTENSITINLNTPYNGFKKLHADASRTQAADGRIAADINLQRGNRKIGIAYDYLFEKSGGSGKVEIVTPYDGFESMMASLEHTSGTNARSFAFMAKRGAREWNLKTTRSWENGVDEGSLVLTSPIDEIRSVKISRRFDIRNLAAMTYDASYERNGRSFVLSGSGGIEAGGAKVSFDITLTMPLKIKELKAEVDYDFTVQPRTIVVRLSGGNRYANLDASLGDKSGTVTLVTTNPKLPKVDISYSANIAKNLRDVEATLVLADGRTLSLVYKADYTTKNHGSGLVKLTSTTFGERKLDWEYAAPGDDLTGSIVYNSPNLKLDYSISVSGKRFVRRRIIVKTVIESPWYSSSRNAVIRYNTKTGFFLNVHLISDGQNYDLEIDAKENAGKRVVVLKYDGKMIKGLKIRGTWTIPRDLESRKEFDITYKRGSRKASLSGFVTLAASGKSGSYDIHLTTPFEEVADLKIGGNWDFVLPNRILNVDYNRNGKRAELNFSGSRYAKHADYSLSMTIPPIEIMKGKVIRQIESTLSVDLRNGYKIKITQLKPLTEVIELDLTVRGNVRTMKALYKLVDTNDMVPWMPQNVDVQFQSKRTTRPNGPLIELGLETNFPEFEKIEASIDVDRTPGSSKVNVDYKRGDRVAKFTGTLDKSETGGSVSFSASTPIAGFNDISLSGSYEAVPERSYALNIDYSRGQKYVHLTSSIKLDIHKDYGKLQSAGAQVNIKFDSMITRPVDLLVTFDGSMTAPPNGSANGKLVSTLNGKTVSVTYSVDRAEAGRRVSRITLTTPLKYPFKKIVYNGDVSLTSNKAAFSLEYGRKKVALDLSWFAGEAHQYGVEVRLNTPFKPVQSLELDVKGTVRPDESIDVMAHYRRGEKMVHVSGNLKRSGFDLDFETPTFGNFNLKASVIPGPQTYSVKALLTMQSGVSAGGEITVRAVSTRDMQLTVDVHTPVRGWERVTVDVAYSNTDESNILRVAFEAPQTKRVEVSFELTNWARNDSTFFKAGVTTNYLGNAFTFRTNILRDDAGMKYELEIESPFHILPSFKLTGTR